MATSAVKITANRANATRSTGPVNTSRTRFNGLAHGLSGKQTVIPGEGQKEYDDFAAGFERHPRTEANTIENVFADRLIAAAWRLQRFTRVETAFLTNRMDAHLEANPDSDPDSRWPTSSSIPLKSRACDSSCATKLRSNANTTKPTRSSALCNPNASSRTRAPILKPATTPGRRL